MYKYLILFLITAFSCSTLFESFKEESNKDFDENQLIITLKKKNLIFLMIIK